MKLAMPKWVSRAALLILALEPSAAFGQATASPFTTGYRWDAMRRPVGEIAPDPDGAGPLGFPAVRRSYNLDGRLWRIETGMLSAWQSEAIAPASWTGFQIHQTTEFSFDAVGNAVKETVTSAGTIFSVKQVSYDSQNRPSCAVTRMNPAAFGSLPSSACELGPEGPDGPDRITKYVFDPAGQLTQLREGVGTSAEAAEATYSYTLNGKREYVIDANGNRAQLTYDGHDRQVKWILPATSRPTAFNDATPATALASAGAVNSNDYEEYGYDANGNRISYRKRDGSTLTFNHDALNRTILKIVPERAGLPSSVTRDVHYEYDLRGLMAKARFDGLSGEGVTNQYTGFGELYSSTITLSGLSAVIGHRYDANGKRTYLIHPDGQTFTYVRDQLGRATTIYEGTSQVASAQLIQANFDGRGLIDTMQRATAGSAFLADFTFDPVGRLASLNQDAVGSANDLMISQSFNHANQIVSQTRNNDAYSWTGSVAVNRNYTTNGLNQYSAAGPASFCYDANGNLTADGTSVYLYDIENRLIEKRVQVAPACPVSNYSGTLQASLSYDPMGRLFQVRGPTSNYRLLYDGDELVAEYDYAGTLANRYVHSDNVDDPVVLYGGAAVGASARIFLMPDERGSIAGLFYNDGTSYGKNTYDEYGIPGQYNQGRFGYTGQAWIPELGMYHYKARIYSPTLGRFLQVDPTGYDDGPNIYAYARNDPIDLTDPDGMEAACVTLNRPCLKPGADPFGDMYRFFFGDVERAIREPSVKNIAVAGAQFTPAGRGIRWAQKTFNPVFSSFGKQFFSEAAGYSIKTVDDLAKALKAGHVRPDQVPLEAVRRGNSTVILNTRSRAALENAGIPQSKWRIVDKTNDANAQRRLDDQLKRNGLDDTGTSKKPDREPLD